MKTTKQGKWFMEAFLKKEVEDGDYNLAVLHDLVFEIKEKGKLEEFVKCTEWLDIAKFLGLIED